MHRSAPQQQPIVIPQAPPINPVGAHVGTPPSIMGAYQPLMGGHHQPTTNTYHHSLVGNSSHYQTNALQQQQLGVGGVSHINQVGSHYPPRGISVSPVPARQPQSSSGVSGLVYPSHLHGATSVPTSLHNPNQPHYPPHHHQTYHSATGSWR